MIERARERNNYPRPWGIEMNLREPQAKLPIIEEVPIPEPEPEPLPVIEVVVEKSFNADDMELPMTDMFKTIQRTSVLERRKAAAPMDAITAANNAIAAAERAAAASALRDKQAISSKNASGKTEQRRRAPSYDSDDSSLSLSSTSHHVVLKRAGSREIKQGGRPISPLSPPVRSPSLKRLGSNSGKDDGRKSFKK